MKKFIYTLIVLFFSNLIQAQSDSNYVELGINTVRLVQLGTGSTASGPHWNPYLLTLEGHYKRLGLRVGLGLTSFNQTELPSDANGKVKTETDTTSNDFRIGVNWEFALHKKWTLKLGVDYFTAKRLNSLTTEFVNEDDDNVSTLKELDYKESGFAPVVFFQYHITPRVSLGTELMWRISSYTRTDSDNTTISGSGAGSNIEIVRDYEGTRRMIMMPTALFLIARF